MKHIISSLLLLAVSFSCFAGSPERHTFKDQGLERIYYLHIPEGLESGAPLLFVLHGYGGRAENYCPGMIAVADKYGFALCYPEGSLDNRGKRCWNVGYPWQKDMKVDDVRFLNRLTKHLQKTWKLSKENVFCTGMSNGGEMCYLLAYRSSDVFAAVAPISGLLMDWMYRDLSPVRAIPLMEVHGTKDLTSQWYGDPENRCGWGAYLPVPMAAGTWAYFNGCNTLSIENIPAKEGGKASEIVLHRYSGSPDGAEVRLYEVKGGVHSWHTDSMDTEEEIWKFFSGHVR